MDTVVLHPRPDEGNTTATNMITTENPKITHLMTGVAS
jgi:hypothetical protein